MGLLFVFLAIILSVVKANTWFFVPTFCVSFCWVVGIFYVFVYVFSKVFAKNVVKDINRQIKLAQDQEVKDKLTQAKAVFEDSLNEQ